MKQLTLKWITNSKYETRALANLRLYNNLLFTMIHGSNDKSNKRFFSGDPSSGVTCALDEKPKNLTKERNLIVANCVPKDQQRGDT